VVVLGKTGGGAGVAGTAPEAPTRGSTGAPVVLGALHSINTILLSPSFLGGLRP